MQESFLYCSVSHIAMLPPIQESWSRSPPHITQCFLPEIGPVPSISAAADLV